MSYCKHFPKCSDFEEFLNVHVPSSLSWGDQMDLVDKFEAQRKDIERYLARDDDSSSSSSDDDSSDDEITVFIGEIVMPTLDELKRYHKKEYKGKKFWHFQPLPTVPKGTRKTQKANCKKGSKCRNRKCTFNHP